MLCVMTFVIVHAHGVHYNFLHADIVWQVIFVESSKSPSKLIFMVLNFVTATSLGAWHCCISDDVIDTRTRNLLCLLSHTYRDLDKRKNISAEDAIS